MTAPYLARASFVLFVFVAAQQTLGIEVHIGSAHADLMLLVPIAAGISGGPQRGAVMGFVAGLLADLFLPTPFGLSALVGCLIGFTVGAAVIPLQSDAWWLPPICAFVASVVGTALYGLLGAVLGQPQLLQVDLPRVVAVVAVVNTVLAGPAMRVVAWALPEPASEGSAPLTAPGDAW